MAILTTTDDIVNQVRSLIDETAVQAASTKQDILPALHRAQASAASIYARRYPDPFLTSVALQPNAGTTDAYDIPEDAFEDRVISVEAQVLSGSGIHNRLVRLAVSDRTSVESRYPGSISPSYYSIVGRQILLANSPATPVSLRVWYMRTPEKLVLSAGRITKVNQTGNYIVVDSPSSDLTTESDSLASFVNIVDGQTGAVKGTWQIASIQGGRVTFRSVPTRTKVLNRSVTGPLPSTGIEPDDYICSVEGTCVCYFGDTATNFLISSAAFDLSAIKLGGETGALLQLVKNFEEYLSKAWSGRQHSKRIQDTSQAWNKAKGRWIFTR